MAAVKIRLNAAQFRKVANTAGHRTNVLISDATGINQPMISRLLKGHETASARIIAAILAAYPDWTFEELFVVDPLGEDEDEDTPLPIAA